MGLTNYLEIEAPVIARLEHEVRDAKAVFGAADLAGMKQAGQVTPALHVIYDGDEVLSDRAGHGARAEEYPTRYRGKAHVRQRWLVVVAVRNAKVAGSGVAVNETAGPLIQRVMEVLCGWQPTQTSQPLTRRTGPRPVYQESYAYFPLLFTMEIFVP